MLVNVGLINMNLFSNKDSTNPANFARSRFQVTPRVDVDSVREMTTTTTTTIITTPATPTDTLTNPMLTGGAKKVPSTPTYQRSLSITNDINNIYQDEHAPPPRYSLPLYEKLLSEPEEENSAQHNNNNTITTTSSSTASFYNTLNYYKYKKLKQNETSLDTLYIPMYIRRPSAFNPMLGISFYNQRVLVYRFLNRPTGTIAVCYHIGVSMAIICFLILTIISTSTKEYSEWFLKLSNIIDLIIIGFFIVEFFARLWSCECISYYRGWKGKIRFLTNPLRIIDLCIIIISLGVLISNTQGELFITSLRGVRFIQIFQMIRLDFKRFRPFRMMASVIYSQKIHLAIVVYLGCLTLILVSFLIYFVEKDHNPDFESLAGTMWWAVVTLCTIGYGDMYPKTSLGKFLTCICSVVGVSIFALPAGILGTGLALKVQEQQRQLKISKRKQPAARLIQAAWRLYVAQQELSQRPPTKPTFQLGNGNVVKIGGGGTGGGGGGGGGVNQVGDSNINYRSVIWKRYESNKKNCKTKTLSLREMNALMFLFSVKFCIAKRDFVKAFKPFSIQDVLEQYAAGHVDMLAKIRIMDHRLEKIQCNTMSGKAQHEIRLRFANHLAKLEYEFQKMQTNLNDLAQNQVKSNLMMENLLKYLMNERSRSDRIEPTKNRILFDHHSGLKDDASAMIRRRSKTF